MNTQTKTKIEPGIKQKKSQQSQPETTDQDSEQKDIKYRSYTLGRRLGIKK